MSAILAWMPAHAATLAVPEGRRLCGDVAKSECKETTRSGAEAGQVDGVPYYFYKDGSGAILAVASADIGNYDRNTIWDLQCQRDAVSGERACTASFRDLWLVVSSKHGEMVSVGAENYPGSMTSIKVGNRRFDTRHRDGDFTQSAPILAAMKNGAPVATRYMKWPYREWLDDEFEVYGAQAALTVMRWIVKSSK